MSDRALARVVRVRVDKHGAVLASDGAVGDVVIMVKDAGDLTDAGGTLLVDDDAGTTLAYTSVEYSEDYDEADLTSPDAVTLAEPLPLDLDAGIQLWAWEEPDDPADDGIIADHIAICVTEDDEDSAETGNRLEADIPPGDLRDDLPAGQQPDPGVPVVLEYDDDTDEWTVLRLRGATRGLRYNRHHLTADAAPDGGTAGDAVTADEITVGVLTRQLPHRRIARSQAFRALVNGVEYGPGAWELDPVNGVVTLTLGGWETTDNADIWFEYWHRGLTVIAPDPDPAPRQWHIDQIITAYEQHGVWTDSGPYVGMSVDEAAYAGLTLYDFDRVWFDWRIPDEWTLPDWAFDTLGIVEVYIEGEFDGNGTVGFVWDINNPGYPSAAEWPDGADSGSHITLDSYWGDESLLGSIHVDGPTTWTHSFALNSTASDPYYEGNNYDDVTHKLEVSLRSRTDDLNWVSGQLALQGDGAVIQPTTFKLWIVGTP